MSEVGKSIEEIKAAIAAEREQVSAKLDELLTAIYALKATQVSELDLLELQNLVAQVKGIYEPEPESNPE